MLKNTWFWCIVGVAIFTFGIALRMYLVVRVRGWKGYLLPQAGVVEAYRMFVVSGGAPSWPLPTSYVLMGLGVAFVFGSILLIG
jgi:hypothetical protein